MRGCTFKSMISLFLASSALFRGSCSLDSDWGCSDFGSSDSSEASASTVVEYHLEAFRNVGIRRGRD